MKPIIRLLSTAITLISFNALAQDCANKTGCDAKACQIKKQIELAEHYGKDHKVTGLKKALNQVNEYCTTDGLQAELHDKIDDVKEDMLEHQDDLEEAIQDKKLDKIEKYKQKLTEDTEELKQLKHELSTLSN